MEERREAVKNTTKARLAREMSDEQQWWRCRGSRDDSNGRNGGRNEAFGCNDDSRERNTMCVGLILAG